VKTDTTEQGLESLIIEAMTGERTKAPNDDAVRDARGAINWLPGFAEHYDREYTVDPVQLRAFLDVTQKDAGKSLDLPNDGPTRRAFLARLQGEITNAAPSMYCATGSNMVRIISICSTVLRRRAI